MRYAIVVVAALAMACKGADGATGPQGPKGDQGPQGVQGIQGPAGAGTKFLALATVNSSGGASVALPAAAGNDINKPPVMSCYVGSTTSTVWLAVAGTPSTTGAYCGLVFSNGGWSAAMNQAPAGWIAAFAVLY